MSDTQSVKVAYGILADVSKRTSRNQKPFVRAKIIAKRKDGTIAFTQEIIAYKPEAVSLLCDLGNGASVWTLGRIKEIPQNQGRYTIKILDVFDVRDSRKNNQSYAKESS